MSDKVYLYLLAVCGFLCQGIIASLSSNNISKSADFLVRHKRVINHEPNGHDTACMSEVKYIVNIRHNTFTHCAGAILSRYTVITAASCLSLHLWEYQIQSGSPYANRCSSHNITSKVEHFGNPPHDRYDGIALIKVDPPFALGPNTGIIHLHVEPVFTGTMAVVSGWGVSHPTSPSMAGRQKLRTIILPIMNHRECVVSYAGHFEITNKHICTYCELKLCATHDWGTPLVINGFLAGIHNYKGSFQGIRNPDVYIDVQRLEYSTWIGENIEYYY